MKIIYLSVGLILFLCMFSDCQTIGVKNTKSLEGVYLVKTSTPMGERDIIIAINADGTGYVEGTSGIMEFSDAGINGNNFDIHVTANTQMGEMDLIFKGTIEGDNMTGTVNSQMGESTFAGKKK